MRDLLGLEMIDKWKFVSKEDNFMQEIEEHMQEYYQCSFGPFYQTWCAILYHYMNQYPKKYREKLERAKECRKYNIETFN